MDDLRKWRRDLHQIPELGLKEEKTAQYLRSALEEMGYQWQSVLQTGTLVYIDAHQKETLAFRSDIDGLKMNEKNDVDYVSKHEGYMHACGHDGHMSALLGFAKRLKQLSHLSYNVLLIFQPAEESPGAAKWIVEAGILQKYHVKAIFGMHLMPLVPQNHIACKAGPFMAMCGELNVKIKGKGAHAGLAHLGKDSIVIAAQAIHEYQTILSRLLSPFCPAVIHCGKIQGGTTRNSVADEVTIEGTIRCFDESVFHDIIEHIEKIHQGLEKSYDCQIEWSCPPMYPPVCNDKQLFEQFKQLILTQDDEELEQPLMLAEDFAYYQKAVPGLFFFLGTNSEHYQSGLHSETFDFDETVLLRAVDTYEKIITKWK